MISVLKMTRILARIVFHVVESFDKENFGKINSQAAKYGSGYESRAFTANVKLIINLSCCVGKLFVMTSDVCSCQVRKPIRAKPVLKIAAIMCDNESIALNCAGSCMLFSKVGRNICDV